MIDHFNAAMSLLLAAAIGWAILSHRVHDGVVVKFGLICLSLGFLGAFLIYLEGAHHHDQAMDNVHALIYIGLLICCFGYWLRTKEGLNRRIKDWIDTEVRQ